MGEEITLLKTLYAGDGVVHGITPAGDGREAL
jgi:hypothetical protein